MGWLDHLDAMPDAARHDKGLTRTDVVARLDADVLLIAIVEHDADTS